MSRATRGGSERSGEEGTLRWVVLVVAGGLGLAAHDLASARPAPQPWIIAAGTSLVSAAVGLTILHLVLRRVNEGIERSVRANADAEAALEREVAALSTTQTRTQVLAQLPEPDPAAGSHLPGEVPALLGELARHGSPLSFGLYTFAVDEIARRDGGWLVATHDSGHLTLVLHDDGRVLEHADDDPAHPVYREHASIWHALLLAIREHEA